MAHQPPARAARGPARRKSLSDSPMMPFTALLDVTAQLNLEKTSKRRHCEGIVGIHRTSTVTESGFLGVLRLVKCSR